MTWKRVSSPLVPEVRVAAQDGRLTVAVAGTDALQPSASLVAARTRVLARELTRFPATVDLSETALGASPLRLWLHVRWQDAHGRTILQETPFSAWLGGTPPEAPAVAEHLDLAALEAELAADALRIRIPFEMPQDGKATLLICDAEGNRIRNLVNGQPFAKGPQMVEWDGRREDGTVAEPGTYTVRTVTHPGLSARIVGRFANGGEKLWEPYGPNHVPFVTLCARGDRVLAASLFTEGGSSMVIMDLEGRRTNAFANSWNLGNAALHAVSGEAQWYAFREKRETAKAPDDSREGVDDGHRGNDERDDDRGEASHARHGEKRRGTKGKAKRKGPGVTHENRSGMEVVAQKAQGGPGNGNGERGGVQTPRHEGEHKHREAGDARDARSKTVKAVDEVDDVGIRNEIDHRDGIGQPLQGHKATRDKGVGDVTDHKAGSHGKNRGDDLAQKLLERL